MTSYEHTQRGWWHIIVAAVAAVMLVGTGWRGPSRQSPC